MLVAPGQAPYAFLYCLASGASGSSHKPIRQEGKKQPSRVSSYACRPWASALRFSLFPADFVEYHDCFCIVVSKD